MSAGCGIEQILAQGGERRIALLRYCVISINTEPVFAFLVREFHLRPTHAGALVLYDMFCASQAPARIRESDALPPRDLRLAAAIEPLRRQWTQLQLPEPPDEDDAISITVPQRHLFDFVVDALRREKDGHFGRISENFDPELTAEENLPGGTMNEAQRHFRENVWRPIVRPQLVTAGFWQIANIE